MIEFNWQNIHTGLVKAALIGLNNATVYCEGRAKDHAPVRRIFAGSRRMGKLPASMGYKKPTRSGVIGAAFGVAEMTAFKRARPPLRRFRDPDSILPGGGASARLGHANSMVPVFRINGRIVAGQFRQYDPATGELAKVPFVTRTRSSGNLRGQVGYSKRPTSGRSQLTYQGAREVASARALYRPPARVTLNEGLGKLHVHELPATIGGRLRGEITHSLPVLDLGQTILWAYVIAPTPYARYQEFGTAHNRAHPFLRPALYESRRILHDQVSRSVKRTGR